MSSPQSLPPAVSAIVSQTFLAKMPVDVQRAVLEGGRRVEVSAGALVAHSPRRPGVGVVVEGLFRVFLRSPEDRQVTVQYARPGEALGLVSLLSKRLAVNVQAVTRSSLWLFSSRRLRELARQSAPLALAIAGECAARVEDAVEELGLVAFGSVRQRVARHLLDLASSENARGKLVAAVTQQELADATGSVREVVARALKELETLGLASRTAGGVAVLDAAGLDAAARVSTR